ncbi:exotoxin OB-fold domain-containing protein [Staphylococcus aureus]|uniref:exotoxin n=1 Tax=Staphylococcus aureus TaxID=1280 RepID=UPI003F187ED5
MNKKTFISRVFIMISLITILSMPNTLAESQPDPTPDQLNKSSQFTGLMENMKYLYDGNNVSATNIKSIDQFLYFDLIFPIKDPILANYDKVRTAFDSKELADKYKNKNVDIFGTNYYYHCYFSKADENGNELNNADKKTCMYGGVTEHEGNHIDNPISVSVNVFEDKRITLSFGLHINKKQVTAQELDVKTREILVNKKRLYEFNSSPYETGYIKFIEKEKGSFWYDMMPPAGDRFSQLKYLMIYSDNKIVDPSKTAIEVHLTKK